MAKKIIHTNPHLRSKEERIKRVARSQSASHAIEGINIPSSKFEEILRKQNHFPSSREK